MTLQYLTAGESHGPGLMAILEGLPAGLELSEDVINEQLGRRQRGFGSGPRMKIESDKARILAGVMAGRTTGAPLGLLIENQDHARWAGVEAPPMTVPRPGHADLTGAVKYGYDDLRLSLERASARETAARVAVGAVCRHFLTSFGIQIGGYVRRIGEVEADIDADDLSANACLAETNDLRCPDPAAEARMRQAVEQAMQARDTLGGVIEVFAVGLPPGLGSHVHWERRLDSRLGAAVLSVPAMKGVEFGQAFHNASLRGAHAQDAIRLDQGRITRPTNRAGGLEGGMSNGQPLIVRAAMKPIATTLTPQESVDLEKGVEKNTVYERSDFCPAPRAVPILEAVVAIELARALLEKLGGDSMDEILPRMQALRGMRLEDFAMRGQGQVFWPGERAE